MHLHILAIFQPMHKSACFKNIGTKMHILGVWGKKISQYWILAYIWAKMDLKPNNAFFSLNKVGFCLSLGGVKIFVHVRIKKKKNFLVWLALFDCLYFFLSFLPSSGLFHLVFKQTWNRTHVQGLWLRLWVLHIHH